MLPWARSSQYAGGLATTAQSRRVTIERIDDRKTRVVDQFDFDEDGLPSAK